MEPCTQTLSARGSESGGGVTNGAGLTPTTRSLPHSWPCPRPSLLCCCHFRRAPCSIRSRQEGVERALGGGPVNSPVCGCLSAPQGAAIPLFKPAADAGLVEGVATGQLADRVTLYHVGAADQAVDSELQGQVWARLTVMLERLHKSAWAFGLRGGAEHTQGDDANRDEGGGHCHHRISNPPITTMRPRDYSGKPHTQCNHHDVPELKHPWIEQLGVQHLVTQGLGITLGPKHAANEIRSYPPPQHVEEDGEDRICDALSRWKHPDEDDHNNDLQ
mmetsp:Transcript_53059/g.147037  ORF Transcript_53059/g.147037 Transcript_53059/m.147037 type:complete len:275 (-) Transcript_53059:113-937(-)